jgi:PTH1 family peptidyl-tRNA hydrolase
LFLVAKSAEHGLITNLKKCDMAEKGIRLVVGLGNPGLQYESTRHNVGYWFVELLAARNGGQFRMENKFHGLVCRLLIAGRDLRLLKPTTFMNRSGQSLVSVVRYFDIAPEQVLVVHDELDLPVGTLRLKQGGGYAGHNGLRDIINVLGTREFWRLRIGIDHPGDRGEVVNYVLERAPRDDENRIRGAFDEAESCLADVIRGEFQRAMNHLHSGR